MGTITITAATSAGNVTKAFPVTDANILRLADFVRSMRRPDDAALSNAQALERWMKWALEMTRDHVVQQERRQAALPDFGLE